MAEDTKKDPYHLKKDPDGYYYTLKQLKNLKFGDTVCIKEIKTPMVQFTVPKEINDDPTSWDAFSKIFISSDFENPQKDISSSMITYIRSDGKLEKSQFTHLIVVCHICLK